MTKESAAHGASSSTAAQKSAHPARVMSGMRTTGTLHIGHYWGAIKNWLKLQEQGPCYFGAMDFHAMTDQYKTPQLMDHQIRDMVAEWIAWGIDPNKNVLFVQSRIPEVLQLYVIFANLTPLGWLERVNTWKDAIEELKAKDAHNLGRLAYPVLQTADIAIFRGTQVPVGKDQVPHIELSRDIVGRFNHLYGQGEEILPPPQPMLTATPSLVGSDGRKMSKSYDNFIPLTEEEKPMQDRLLKMPTDPARVRRTDPGDPEKCPVFELHKLYSTAEDIAWVVPGCKTAGIGCRDCKMRLFSNMNELTKKPREKKKEVLQDPSTLDLILDQGTERARDAANITLTAVRKAMSFHSGRGPTTRGTSI